MKTIHLIFLFILSSNAILNAQSILAGSHGESDYYIDIAPDFVLINGGDYHSNGNKYPIDLNGDGIIDISITGSMMGWNYRIGNISVTAEEHCKVAFESIDTISPSFTEGECIGKSDKYFNSTQNFSALHPINHSIQWSDSIHNYIIYDYIQGCYPNSSNSFSSGIIGVQLTVDSETLYAWVKLSNMFLAPFDGASVTIEEYACNRQMNGTNTVETKPSILISPNPCNDMLTIELTHYYKNGVISIFNLNGNKLREKKINSSKHTIDLSQLNNGIYLIKLNDGTNNYYKKIIKV